MDFFERDFVCVSVILVVIATVDGRADGVLSPTVWAVSDDGGVVRHEGGASSATIIASAHWAAAVADRPGATDDGSVAISAAAAEQSVEMLAKAGADAIEGDGVDAGIDVSQDEAGDL